MRSRFLSGLIFVLLFSSCSARFANAELVETQRGPTSGDEMVPPFDPRYFLGVWEIEWNPPETGLFPPGKWTGTETV